MLKQHDLQNSWFSAAAEISQLALFNNQKTKMSKVHQKKLVKKARNYILLIKWQLVKK